VIADRIIVHTTYDIRYSYRPLTGITVVSMSIYLFTVSNVSVLLMPEVYCWTWCLSAFSRSMCFVAKRYILQQNCLNKWIGSPLLGTRLYNLQPLHRRFDPEWHNTTYIVFFIFTFVFIFVYVYMQCDCHCILLTLYCMVLRFCNAFSTLKL